MAASRWGGFGPSECPRLPPVRGSCGTRRPGCARCERRRYAPCSDAVFGRVGGSSGVDDGAGFGPTVLRWRRENARGSAFCSCGRPEWGFGPGRSASFRCWKWPRMMIFVCRSTGIRQLADQRGGVLSAIESSERAAGDFMDPQSTLLASSEVRQLLAKLTAVRFQSPSRRCRSFHRRISDRLRATAVHLRHRMRGLFLRREVSPSDQCPHESDVLEAVRSAMSPIEVSLCEGQGSTGWTARGVVVPRSQPAIAVGADLISS